MMIFPTIPIWEKRSDNTPTLYSIMESMSNFGKDDKTKIKNLAEATREQIFNFNYPLNENVPRGTFETMILNHYLTRRINYETFTLFQIRLCNKLNEIMPKYNLMFGALQGWELFKGSTITHEYSESGTDNRTTTSTSNNTGETKSDNMSDRRHSDTPQQTLSNVREGKYISDYNYDTDKATISNTTNMSLNGTDNNTISKNIIETTSSERENESEILMEFASNYNNIYTLIFEDLDELFLGVL